LTASGEGLIREKIVRDNLVECIIALPKQLFYNTGIPATIWILRRGREITDNETLFIDASELGYMKTRVIRDFTDEEISKIEETYKNWRNKNNYKDVDGFCKSANLEEIEEHDFVLTPGRYVGIPDEEDDGIPFDEKMSELTSILSQQIEQEKILDDELKEQLSKIGFTI
jgi:type I restriction enzyme M protein